MNLVRVYTTAETLLTEEAGGVIESIINHTTCATTRMRVVEVRVATASMTPTSV